LIGLVFGGRNKILIEIDPETQDLLDSDVPSFPRPEFTSNPPYFVIGGILSLSFSDDSPNPEGYQSLLALKCAIADMNAIGPERGLSTKWYSAIINDRSQPKTAMQAAVQLLEAGISASIGPSQPDAAIAVASFSSAFNQTKLDGQVTLSQLSDRNAFGAFFRTVPSDVEFARTIGNLLVNFGWTLITPIYTDNEYGRSGKRAFTSVSIQLGILLTCGRIVSPGSVSGIQNTIKCLTVSQSSVVLLWMEPVDAFNIISEFYNSQSLPDITFVAPSAWGDIRDVQIYSKGRFPNSYLEGSVSVITSIGNQDIFRECIQRGKVNATEIPYFLDFLETNFKCRYAEGFDNSIEFPPCPVNLADRSPSPNINCSCLKQDNLGQLSPSVFQFPLPFTLIFYLVSSKLRLRCSIRHL
jgi:hypothetical protein